MNYDLKIEKGSKFEEIKLALKKTQGYCPCVPKYAWGDDTKCICKNFAEQENEGECHCGMFRKVIDDGR